MYMIRVYTKVGCPFCDATVKYFESLGINPDIIVVDQLLTVGIPAALHRDKLEVPVTVNLSTNELVIGYNPNAYAQLLREGTSGDVVDQTPSNRDAAESFADETT